MYERFTDRSRKVMQLANQSAQSFSHEHIGTEHVLLGMMKMGGSNALNVISSFGVDEHSVCLDLVNVMVHGPLLGKMPQTPCAKKVIEYAMEEARNMKHNYVGTEHLLLGLLRETEGIAAQVLMGLGLKLEEVRTEVAALVQKQFGQKGGPEAEMYVREKLVEGLAEDINAKTIQSLTMALTDAWVDYDNNPYQMGTPEYEALTMGHVNRAMADGSHQVNMVHQLDPAAVTAIANSEGKDEDH